MSEGKNLLPQRRKICFVPVDGVEHGWRSHAGPGGKRAHAGADRAINRVPPIVVNPNLLRRGAEFCPLVTIINMADARASEPSIAAAKANELISVLMSL